MSTQITKVVSVRISGAFYRVKHDSSFTLGGHDAEPVAADGKAYVGIQKEPVTSTFEIVAMHANDLDMVEFKNLADFPVDFITDTGSIYRISDANWSSPPSFQGGEVSCSGFGSEAKKVV